MAQKQHPTMRFSSLQGVLIEPTKSRTMNAFSPNQPSQGEALVGVFHAAMDKRAAATSSCCSWSSCWSSSSSTVGTKPCKPKRVYKRKTPAKQFIPAHGSNCCLVAVSGKDLKAAAILTGHSATTMVKKKIKAVERLERSRERNRIHARKTRERKKAMQQNLESRANVLKDEQIRLKLIINEKNTASILVGLLSRDSQTDDSSQDPRVEELLQRPADAIPASDKISELPALILPGQHASTRGKASCVASIKDDLPDDGIDYDLLGKDRSKCTPQELERIRRERNRMHAKRTRDRKRLFMEEMADMCRTLEEENDLLHNHLLVVAPDQVFVLSRPKQPTPLSSPELGSTEAPDSDMDASSSSSPSIMIHSASPNGVTFDQVKTLLEAAGSFALPSAVSCSDSGPDDHDESSDNTAAVEPLAKRRRLQEIPNSITI